MWKLIVSALAEQAGQLRQQDAAMKGRMSKILAVRRPALHSGDHGADCNLDPDPPGAVRAGAVHAATIADLWASCHRQPE